MISESKSELLKSGSNVSRDTKILSSSCQNDVNDLGRKLEHHLKLQQTQFLSTLQGFRNHVEIVDDIFPRKCAVLTPSDLASSLQKHP